MLSIPCVRQVHIARPEMALGRRSVSPLATQMASADAAPSHLSQAVCLLRLVITITSCACPQNIHSTAGSAIREGTREPDGTAGSYCATAQVKDRPALKLVVHAVYREQHPRSNLSSCRILFQIGFGAGKRLNMLHDTVSLTPAFPADLGRRP